MTALPAATTALVLIDLQNGITSLPILPHDGAAIVARSKALADKFRAAGAPVVLVNVAFAPDFADALQAPTDRAMPTPPGGYPADWADLAEGLAQPGDLFVTKRQWGAFFGTELDLQLRRRGITTIVLGGIATNIGVESTARDAREHGYGLVIPEDITGTFSQEMQDFAFQNIFPLIARVTTSDAITLEG